MTLDLAVVGCGRKCTTGKRDTLRFSAAKKRVGGMFVLNKVSEDTDRGSMPSNLSCIM